MWTLHFKSHKIFIYICSCKLFGSDALKLQVNGCYELSNKLMFQWFSRANDHQELADKLRSCKFKRLISITSKLNSVETGSNEFTQTTRQWWNTETMDLMQYIGNTPTTLCPGNSRNYSKVISEIKAITINNSYACSMLPFSV